MNGSVLLLQIICINCNNCEKQIIQLFTQKYKLRKDIGNEYFEGNYHNMIADFFELVVLEQRNAAESNVDVVAIQEAVVEDLIVVDELVVEYPAIIENELIVDNYSFDQFINLSNGKYYSCEKCRYKTKKRRLI